MRILFTKLRHIGDNLLITPTVVATKQKFPDAEIWVAVRRGTEGILAGCPEIYRVVTTARPEESRRTWRDLCADIFTTGRVFMTRFDYAFELGDNNRGRILVAASQAKERCTNNYEHPEGEPLAAFWKHWFNRLVTTGHGPVHQVMRDYNAVREVFSLPEEAPPLRFDPGAWDSHPLQALIQNSYVVVHAATRWSSKAWPIDRWREVVAVLLEKFPRVIISCGPNDREIEEARMLCEESEGRAISTGGSFSWRQMASLLGNARLFVGVDTAAMHLAAAVQCPSVALFGQPPAYQFKPWRADCRVVRSRDDMPEKQRIVISGEQLMKEITVEEVLGALNSILGDRPTAE